MKSADVRVLAFAVFTLAFAVCCALPASAWLFGRATRINSPPFVAPPVPMNPAPAPFLAGRYQLVNNGTDFYRMDTATGKMFVYVRGRWQNLESGALQRPVRSSAK